jgi:hypothetical protein
MRSAHLIHLRGDPKMFRKLSLAAVAAIALGTAALAPTSASAWWHGGPRWHGGWHHGWGGGWGWGGPRFYYGGYGGYGCRRWVETPWGPRLRWVC